MSQDSISRQQTAQKAFSSSEAAIKRNYKAALSSRQLREHGLVSETDPSIASSRKRSRRRKRPKAASQSDNEVSSANMVESDPWGEAYKEDVDALSGSLESLRFTWPLIFRNGLDREAYAIEERAQLLASGLLFSMHHLVTETKLLHEERITRLTSLGSATEDTFAHANKRATASTTPQAIPSVSIGVVIPGAAVPDPEDPFQSQYGRLKGKLSNIIGHEGSGLGTAFTKFRVAIQDWGVVWHDRAGPDPNYTRWRVLPDTYATLTKLAQGDQKTQQPSDLRQKARLLAVHRLEIAATRCEMSMGMDVTRLHPEVCTLLNLATKTTMPKESLLSTATKSKSRKGKKKNNNNIAEDANTRAVEDPGESATRRLRVHHEIFADAAHERLRLYFSGPPEREPFIDEWSTDDGL